MTPEEQAALEAAFVKQQQLFELYTKSVLNSLENAGKKYKKTIEDGTKAHTDRFDKVQRGISGGWGRLMERASLSFNTMLRDMTKEAGRAGGFGDLGVDMGKKIGSSIGEMMATKFGKKLGGISPTLGKNLGSLLGGSVVAGAQSLEGMKILGARFMPVVTAGREQRSDFGVQGAQLIQRTNAIRQATGAATEEVYGLATELSRLGIPFDAAGEKATRYALAAERVLNLEKNMVATMDATIVTKYGGAWEDVASILHTVSSATEYWNFTAQRTHSSLANSLASNNTLSKMYMEVATALQTSSFESKALGEALVGTVNVMGQMGLRPGMMGSVSKEFMQKLAPKTGGFMSMVSQGYFLSDLLKRSDRGMQLLAGARGVAETMKIDPNLITLPLNQMLASNDAMSSQFFQAMLEGISNMQQAIPGNLQEKTTNALFRLEGTLGISPTTGYVMLTMADQYKENIARGMKPDEAWTSIGKSKAYQDAVSTQGMAGMSPDEVLKAASGMGAASFSTQEKLSMAAESLAAMTGEKFWSKFRTEGKVLFDAAARIVDPKTATAMVPPTPPAIPEPAIPEAFEPMPEGGPLAQPGSGALFKPMFGYSKSTSRGIEQTTILFSSDIDSLAEGIAFAESAGSGGYAALGKVILDPKSSYYGDRAYGRYQIMGKNIPQWTKEATGKEMTPEEFYSDHAAQDKVAKFQMNKLRKAGHSPADIASIWHSGVPLKTAIEKNRRDLGTGMSTQDYVRKVINNMPRRSG